MAALRSMKFRGESGTKLACVLGRPCSKMLSFMSGLQVALDYVFILGCHAPLPLNTVQRQRISNDENQRVTLKLARLSMPASITPRWARPTGSHWRKA